MKEFLLQFLTAKEELPWEEKELPVVEGMGAQRALHMQNGVAMVVGDDGAQRALWGGHGAEDAGAQRALSDGV